MTLTWLSIKVGLDILILMSDTEREISAEGEIELFDSIIAGGSLYLTGIGIDEERD